MSPLLYQLSYTAKPNLLEPGNPLLFVGVLSPNSPDVLRAFRRRSPDDSPVRSSAPPGRPFGATPHYCNR